MSEQSIVSLVGQLGAVGALVLMVWRAFMRHAEKVETYMEKQLAETVAMRTEVRTTLEMLSDGRPSGRYPRLRTSPGYTVPTPGRGDEGDGYG